MKVNNLTLTSKWAVYGAIVALGTVGVNSAIGQKYATRKAPAVDGWRASGIYQTSDWPQMKFEVKLENTESSSRNAQFIVKLVQTEYKGDPASRVVRPQDMIRVDLESQTLNTKISGLETKTLHVTFKSKPDTNVGRRRINYMMEVLSDGNPITGIVAQPAAPGSPPKRAQ